MSRGVKIAVAVVSVGLVAAAFGARISQARARDAEAKEAMEVEAVLTVRTAPATSKDLPQLVQITGSVRAGNEVQVLPKMPGRVTRVLVEVGAQVKAGDVLAAVEAVDMALRVKQAQAQLQAVQAGLAQAQLQKEQAERGFNRARALKEKGALSVLEFENAESGFRLAGIGVQAAVAQVSLAEANLGLSQKSFDDTRITTPVDGVVTKKQTSVGSMANPAMPAFAVQDQSTLKLEGTVPATYVPRLEVGMAVEVEVDELPGRRFAGKLARVAPTLEAETRRGAIEVELPPADGLLPYMFGRARIALGETADVVVVPSAAVLSVGGQPALYRVNDGKAELVRPQLGARVYDDVIVESGVKAGDQLVVSGEAGLKHGVRVSLAKN
jgi:RND family efflux transporter MFP subunit